MWLLQEFDVNLSARYVIEISFYLFIFLFTRECDNVVNAIALFSSDIFFSVFHEGYKSKQGAVAKKCTHHFKTRRTRQQPSSLFTDNLSDQQQCIFKQSRREEE